MTTVRFAYFPAACLALAAAASVALPARAADAPAAPGTAAPPGHRWAPEAQVLEPKAVAILKASSVRLASCPHPRLHRHHRRRGPEQARPSPALRLPGRRRPPAPGPDPDPLERGRPAIRDLRERDGTVGLVPCRGADRPRPGAPQHRRGARGRPPHRPRLLPVRGHRGGRSLRRPLPGPSPRLLHRPDGRGGRGRDRHGRVRDGRGLRPGLDRRRGPAPAPFPRHLPDGRRQPAPRDGTLGMEGRPEAPRLDVHAPRGRTEGEGHPVRAAEATSAATASPK